VKAVCDKHKAIKSYKCIAVIVWSYAGGL